MDARIWMMKRKDVCKVFGTSSAGLHRGMIDGRYPRPYHTGLNSVRWRSDEVQQKIEELLPVTAETTKQVAPGSKRGRPKKRVGHDAESSDALAWVFKTVKTVSDSDYDSCQRIVFKRNDAQFDDFIFRIIQAGGFGIKAQANLCTLHRFLGKAGVAFQIQLPNNSIVTSGMQCGYGNLCFQYVHRFIRIVSAALGSHLSRPCIFSDCSVFD